MGGVNSILLMMRQHLIRVSVLSALLCAGLSYAAYLLHETEVEWAQTLEQRDPRQTAISRMRHHLGYGGLVHNYLNSILRDKSSLEDNTMLDMGAMRGTLLEFETLDTSPIERTALAAIRTELHVMRVAMERINNGDFAGKTPEEVYGLAGVDLMHLASAVDMLVSASRSDGSGKTTYLALLSNFEGAIGLDGLVHHLKVYLLTRNPDHLQQAKAAAMQAQELLDKLAARATSSAEIEAIRVIDQTIRDYAEGISTARDMAGQGATASQIDKAIRVDDSAALSGYATLVSFEMERLNEQMQAVGSGLLFAKVIAIVLIFLVVVPFVIQYVRVSSGLMKAVPRWGETLAGIGTALANEEFDKSADYSTLPRELSTVEEPFAAIRRALWFRREQALEAEQQVDALAIENEHLHDKIDKTAGELEDVSRQTTLAQAAAHKAQGVNDMMGSVMGALSVGVLASRGMDELLFWNARVAELMDVPLEWFTTERTLSDLVLYQATRGDYGAGDPMKSASKVEAIISKQLEEGFYSYDQNIPGKRVVAVEMVKRESGMIVFSGTDVTERHNHAVDMERQAVSDPLTGLANRTALNDFTESMLKHTKRAGEKAAILALDLDGFKPINDELGHQAGDDTLVEIARRLREEIRETDFVARTGGDEFVLILLHLDEAEGAARFARRLLRAIEVPITLSTGEIVRVTGSIGVSVFPDDTENLRKLYRQADEALYGAKAAGRNCVKSYGDIARDLYDEAGISTI